MTSEVVEYAAMDAPTLAAAFRITAAENSNETWVKNRDGSVLITWGEGLARADRIAGGLRALGIAKGDTVALMLVNRPEFHIVDFGVTIAGGTPFSVYQTYTADQIDYLLKDSESKLIVTEPTYLETVQAACAALDSPPQIVLVDGPPSGVEGTISLAEVEEMDPDFDGAAATEEIGPDDVLTLIYTSGTTGPPKGVQLSHRNLMSTVRGTTAIVNFPRRSRVISWLPSAHIAERAAHHYIPAVMGFEITSVPDHRLVMEVLPEVRPNWFFAVPRIWEKLRGGLQAMVAGQPDEQREPLEQALSAAIEKVRLEQAGEEVPAELAATVAEADEKYFAALRAMLGLDQVVTINVGAAPTPLEVLEFFHAIGLPLAELWGMSETCGGGTVNPPGEVRLGTVGPAVPGVELKLAEDGEVMIRGDLIMLGYRNMADETAATIDADGWLATGDIGQFDDAMYLKIVDRKKELIINAAGKNMSPANIEAQIKTASPLIDQVCCIGDGRSYNTALISLDGDFAPQWAAREGIEDASIASLSQNAELLQLVQEAVDEGNSHLARVEQIKKFKLLSTEWEPGGDELTPTMKLKRKPIATKYADEIEALYAPVT
ncbi:MAG: long-chain fatty acid--CoA ligase [Solirubrobacteraceae bacterium]|nr:long-chain fatty acid--CoA ligase [Solirubrobacteraceae bacterium]